MHAAAMAIGDEDKYRDGKRPERPFGVCRGGVSEAEPYQTADSPDRAVDLVEFRKAVFGTLPELARSRKNDGPVRVV